MDSQQSFVLIYDAQCPICCAAVMELKKRTVPGAMEPIACQSEERAARFPHISETECLRAVQVIAPDGTIYQGAKALPHLLRLMRRWRWLGHVVALPGISGIAHYVYQWFAPRRYWFSQLLGVSKCHTHRATAALKPRKSNDND